MSGRNVLDDIFNTPEESVETFVDAIKDTIEDPDKSDVSRMVSGRPDKISAPQFAVQQSGFIQIESGWHGEDYVWHIAPYHPRKPWKVSMDRVLYAIAKVMNEVIPATIVVKIFPPYDDWQVKEITFKAIDMESAWNITDQSLQELNVQLLEVLNTLV